MGSALVRGMVGSRVVRPDDLALLDIDIPSALRLAGETGAHVADSPDKALAEADIVLLAMKPAQTLQWLSGMRSRLTSTQAVLSIAAGVSLSSLRDAAGPYPVLIRAMPNTAALVGEGVTALCTETPSAGAEGPSPERCRQVMEKAKSLLSSVGLVVEVPEDRMDAVTGLSGSGPAYMMLAIEAMADAGVALGIPRADAMRMAAQTVRGAGSLVLSTGQHPGVLKDQVCSPGGTTIQAIRTLERQGFRSALMEAVLASAEKSAALSGKRKE